MRVVLVSLIILYVVTGAPLCGAEPGAFSFAVLGDPQPPFPGERWWEVSPTFRAIVPELNLLVPEFVVIVGDHVGGPRENVDGIVRMWDEFDRVAGRLTMPLHRAPGNHDIWNEASRRIYTERYGPSYYSFDREQFAWLEADLEDNRDARFTFVFFHRPLWELAEARWEAEIHPIFARYGVDYVFAGHHHVYRFDGVRDGVAYTITGGGGGSQLGGMLGGAF